MANAVLNNVKTVALRVFTMINSIVNFQKMIITCSISYTMAELMGIIPSVWENTMCGAKKCTT